MLEILIVLGISAGVVTLFVSRIDNRNSQVKASIRELAVLSRELYYKSKLGNATYRLVINMNDGADSKEAHTFWVEKGNKDFLLSDDNTHSAFSKRAQISEEAKKEQQAKESVGGFSVDTQTMKSPKSLPGNIFFEDVELVSQKEPLTDGKIYIHYLPQGFVEEAAIHIKLNEKIRWTLAIHPLTGRGQIFSEYVSLEEIRDQ